jgi:hypothetical protein
MYLLFFLYPFLLYHTLTVLRFFIFSLDLYTIGRTPWTSDRPVARPLPKYRTIQTENKRTHARTRTHTHTKHSCPKWDLNPQSQRLSERRQFMPYTAQLTWPAVYLLTCSKFNYNIWTLLDDNEKIKHCIAFFHKGKTVLTLVNLKVIDVDLLRLSAV